MVRNGTVLMFLMLSGFALTIPVQGVHTACPAGPASSANTSLTDVRVSSTLSNLQSGSCTGGPELNSLAFDCPVPPLGFTSVDGAYCGPIVPTQGSALCRWTPVINTVTTRLYLGFDWSGDGRLTAPDEKVWGPMAADTYYSIQNTGASAAMIAFPTNVVDAFARPSDESIVGCLVA